MFYQDVATIDSGFMINVFIFMISVAIWSGLEEETLSGRKINDDNDNHDCNFQDNKNNQQLEFHVQEF